MKLDFGPVPIVVYEIRVETFAAGELEARDAALRVLEHQEGDGPNPRRGRPATLAGDLRRELL